MHAAALTREQSLKALDHPEAAQRIEAVERLGAIGRMADADTLMRRLDDDDDDVRAAATDAIWQIWSRSGDAAIDTAVRARRRAHARSRRSTTR